MNGHGNGRAVRAVAVAVAVLSLVVARLLVASADELAQAERATAGGDVDGAIVHYRRAARLYVPGSPFVAQALTALATLGTRAESDGDAGRALAAWRAVHAATVSTRSFYAPHDEAREEADRHVARLMARRAPPPRDGSLTPAQRARSLHRALVRSRDPRLGYRLLALGGFLAWIAGLLLFALRGLDAEDRWVPAMLRRAGTLMVAGFSLFVLGLALA